MRIILASIPTLNTGGSHVHIQLILNGGNVAFETNGANTVTGKYVRGINLINSTIGGFRVVS